MCTSPFSIMTTYLGFGTYVRRHRFHYDHILSIRNHCAPPWLKSSSPLYSRIAITEMAHPAEGKGLWATLPTRRVKNPFWWLEFSVTLGLLAS